MGRVAMKPFTVITKLVPYPLFKSLQLIWRAGSRFIQFQDKIVDHG